MAIPFEKSVGLGAPTALLVSLSNIFDAAFDSNFYAVSVHAAWAMDDHTAGEGPLEVGWAHDDYDVTEIQEALNAEGNTRGNMIEIERRRRKVRSVAYFHGRDANESLADGRQIKTKLGWTIIKDDNLTFWMRNHDATMTTGTVVNVTGVLYGRWV